MRAEECPELDPIDLMYPRSAVLQICCIPDLLYFRSAVFQICCVPNLLCFGNVQERIALQRAASGVPLAECRRACLAAFESLAWRHARGMLGLPF